MNQFEYRGYIFNRTISFNNDCIRVSITYFKNGGIKYCFNDVPPDLQDKSLEPILDNMIEKVEEDINPKWKRMLEGTPMGEIFNV